MDETLRQAGWYLLRLQISLRRLQALIYAETVRREGFPTELTAANQPVDKWVSNEGENKIEEGGCTQSVANIQVQSSSNSSSSSSDKVSE